MTDENEMPEQGKMTTDPCVQMQVNLPNAGEFIKVDEAVASLKRYFALPTTPSPDDPDHVYGHTFGLNKIRKLLFDIDLYNTELKPGEKKISGLRIYYGVSERHDPDFPVNGPCADLIFMPVKEDGVDIYTIHSLSGGEEVLSNSRPCPNQCGAPPLMFIQ